MARRERENEEKENENEEKENGERVPLSFSPPKSRRSSFPPLLSLPSPQLWAIAALAPQSPYGQFLIAAISDCGNFKNPVSDCGNF